MDPTNYSDKTITQLLNMDTDDLIDFNLKVHLKEVSEPPITETDVIYKDDTHKLFQVVGVNDTNKCIIREVGHDSDEKKDYSMLVHKTKINDCLINIYTPIYKLCDIDKMRLIVMELHMIFEEDVIGLYQFCFHDIEPDRIFNKEIGGYFFIYDAIDEKIIKKYDNYINFENVITELIISITE